MKRGKSRIPGRLVTIPSSRSILANEGRWGETVGRAYDFERAALSPKLPDHLVYLLALPQLGIELRSAPKSGDGVSLPAETSVSHAQVIAHRGIVRCLVRGE